MPRLATCITAYEPGGQSVVVEETSRRFADSYDIDLYCVRSAKPKPDWIKSIYHVKPWAHKYLPLVDEGFVEEIRGSEYDVIHCHDSLPFMNAFYTHGIDYYCTAHGNATWYYRDGLTQKIDGIASYLFYGPAYRKARKVATTSEFVREWLDKVYGVEAVTIYWGADQERFHPLDKDPQNSRFPTLLYFGQLSKRKGIWDLLRLVRQLKGEYPEILLNLGGFGQPEFIEKVESYIAKNGLEDHVDLLGYIPDQEQLEYYNQADAVVFASYWEGFGLPIVEAYMCNKPIFVRDCSAMKELVRDPRFRFRDFQGMVAGLEYFLSHGSEFEKDYSKSLDFNIFDWDHVATQYLEIFGK